MRFLLLSPGLLNAIHEGESCINHRHSASERRKPALMQLAHLFVTPQRSWRPPWHRSADSWQQPGGPGSCWEGPETSVPRKARAGVSPCPSALLFQPALAPGWHPLKLSFFISPALLGVLSTIPDSRRGVEVQQCSQVLKRRGVTNEMCSTRGRAMPLCCPAIVRDRAASPRLSGCFSEAAAGSSVGRTHRLE